ncbi:hypothetical protein, partial [Devosia sp.]|uniref:hypothetical protein n=1 Tax=Devosia sp. TaxID=1871048 RepID=UPI001AC1E3F6
MDGAPKHTSDRALHNGLVGIGAVLIFDGKGGMKRCEPTDPPHVIPPHGFKLIVGNSKGPEFKLWLKGELGEFNSGLLTAPTSRARCTVMDDRALVMLRVVRPGAAPHDVGRQFLTVWIEEGRVIIASELNILDFLGLTKWEQAAHAPVSPADLIAVVDDLFVHQHSTLGESLQFVANAGGAHRRVSEPKPVAVGEKREIFDFE